MNKELAINLLRGSVLGTNEQLHEAVFMAIKALKAEPKHGKWIRDAENFSKYYCSECGFSYIPIGVPKDNFCPNCGSDNREVGNV